MTPVQFSGSTSLRPEPPVKDVFEKTEQFTARLQAYHAHRIELRREFTARSRLGQAKLTAGTAHLIASLYDPEDGKMPLRLEMGIWASHLAGIDQDGSISIPPGAAKTLISTGKSYPVFVGIADDGSVNQIFLTNGKESWPIAVNLKPYLREGGPPRVGDIWMDPVSRIEFVWVPGGSFEMGCGPWGGECSNSELPVHRVKVPGFWLGRTEVTQGQWERVMGNNPSPSKNGDNFPVDSVSWHDAQDFLRRLNGKGNGAFRLPSEAEWEYACRSGGWPEPYCGGDNHDRVAWHSKNSGSSTHTVGTKSANGLGLFDMSGNVWEWVEDCWHDNYVGALVDSKAWAAGDCSRVLRGGSWTYIPRNVRSAYRNYHSPVGRGSYIFGFRVARTLNLVP